MANTIKIKRATEANIGTLEEGEVAFLTDVKRLVVGAADGNQLVDFVTEADLDARLDGMTIDVLSTAEYEALDQTAKNDATKLYILNDATDTVIDLSGYVTKNGTDRLMTEAEATKLAGIDMDTKADKVHIHAIGDVTDLQDVLDNKAAVDHTHDDLATKAGLTDYAKTADVDTKLADKADKVHTHTTADVTDFATEMAKKADVDHTHEIAKVNGLQDALNSKAVGIGIDGTSSKIRLKNAANEFIGDGISLTDLKSALDNLSTP